jgi:hypothetical protein
MAVADEALPNEMAKHPLREMMRKTGLSQQLWKRFVTKPCASAR